VNPEQLIILAYTNVYMSEYRALVTKVELAMAQNELSIGPAEAGRVQAVLSELKQLIQ